MKKLLFVTCWLLVGFCGQSHPGIGIVKDSKGNIYYTDLKQVWKIHTSGQRSVAVHGVHTHELYIDKNDNLFGEHLWYNGEKLDTWGHYLWRLNRNGKLDTVIRPSPGFLEDYSFCQDSAGNMYSVQRFKPKSKIIKTSPSGVVTVLAEKEFKDVRWLFVTPGGLLYFVDLTDLYKIENGELFLIASTLEEKTSLFEYANLQHNVYGIWNDVHDNVYVAVLGGQVVKKISAKGKVSDVIYSKDLWRPCSGIFDNDENLWLMEINPTNEIRVRKISKEELSHSPLPLTNVVNKARPFVIAAIGCVLLFSAIYWLRRLISKRWAATM